MTSTEAVFEIPENYTELTPIEFRTLLLQADQAGISLEKLKEIAIEYVKANEDKIVPEYRGEK